MISSASLIATVAMRLPLLPSSAIKSIMIVFKTEGVISGSETLFSTTLNNKTYSIKMSAKSGDSTKNILNLVESNILNTDGREGILYINGKQAPLNQAEISLKEWTSLIIQFKKPETSSNSEVLVLGTSKTTIGVFSSYSQPIDAQRESVVYNFWEDINNLQWSSYYVNNDYWENILAEITDISSGVGTDTIWDTFLGRNNIVQVPGVISTDETILLQMGNYQYETYSDTIKQSIYRSPA